MANLDDLKSSQTEIKSQLRDKEKERERYLAISSDIDALNLEKASYENKASRCNGLIGYFESAINSLSHRIENWFN